MLNYLLFIATIGSIYALLALSLNLIWGGAGMVNLGLAGFFAVGAYASALLTTTGHMPILAGWALALIVGGAAGLVVVLSTTRLREDYLAIVTLGFAEVVRLVASNEIWLTRGTDGISGIPGPWRAALGREYFNAAYLPILLVVLLAVFWLMRRIDRSPYGRALRAIREDAQVAQVAGKPVLRFKAQAFALSAAIAGLAGALYGHFTSYIAPDLFLPLITVYIFLAVASGGVGSPIGALVGAYLLMALLESARFFVELIPAGHRRAARRAQGAADRRRPDPGAAPDADGPVARTHPARTACVNLEETMTPLDSCIAALRSGPTEALFKAVDKGIAEIVGHKLFTLLYVAPNGKRVKRLYTNMPKEYPVGGYKEIKDTAVAQASSARRSGRGSATTPRTSNGRFSTTS